MKKNTIVIFEDQKIKIPFDIIVDPKKANEGTLRKLYGISIDKNSVHGSDSVENAKKEIGFFFK